MTRPDGEVFAVRVEAGGSGPAMLLVHGLLASARQWEPNLAAMRRHVRPVAIDLWGHGESPGPEDPARYALAAIVGQLDAVRASLGAERWVVCGHSFGAGIALRYALTHPQRVVAAIASNSSSAFSTPEIFGGPQAARERALHVERGGVEAIRRMPIHPSHARRLDPALRARAAADADRVSLRALARLIEFTGPSLSVRSELDRLACPVLIVNGAWEKRFQPLKDYARSRIPDCEVADVEAGHAVNLENPAGYDAAVTAFLQRVLG